MTDFPGVSFGPPHLTLATFSSACSCADYGILTATNANTSAVWPTANTAIYVPMPLAVPATIFKMAFIVATQSGNCDVGIYDAQKNRLVSSGSTAVGAAGIQVVDIADTLLTPGVYFLGMNVDNTTASFRRSAPLAEMLRACGVQVQAVGAVTLPDPAVFANPANAYLPALMASLVVTV